MRASDAPSIEAAFKTLAQRTSGLLVAADPFFFGEREKIVALAAQYKLPAMHEWRQFVEAGGLASYGTKLKDAYRQAGMYAARILRGEKPADLPVVQSSQFEFVINAKTAKALGLPIPTAMQLLADEVIE